MLTLTITFPDSHTESHCYSGNPARCLELIELKKAEHPGCNFEVTELAGN
jgi:hypothetical protein